MSNQILHFNSYPIESIEINGKKYISSANMSNALEYSTSKSITNLFNANREEFTEGEDYTVIDSMTIKNAPYKQIFFSMEGVILITMLAKTPKAVDFRKWAKNTLANLPQPKELSRIEILQMAIDSERRVLALENTVKEKDDVIEAQENIIDEFITISNTKNYTTVGKILHQKPLQFIQWLRDNKYIRQNREPYQEYLDMKLFVIKTPKNVYKHHEPSYHITPKGFEYFRKELVEKKPAELNN